jgi:hypothetical protein
MATHQDEAHSPSHIAMTGHDFSPEDIQALLGGVLPEESLLQETHSGEGAATSTANTMVRTERKRKLEKQRRSDVNLQFGLLQDTLRLIETEEPEQVHGLPAYSPSNRVDLIARSVALLQNLHTSAKRRKVQIEDLERQLLIAKQAGEDTAAKLKESMMAPQAMGNNKVMMMVPMMIGGEQGAATMMQSWMPGFTMPPALGNTTEHTTATPASQSMNSAASQMQQQMMPYMMPPSAMMQGMQGWSMPSMPSGVNANEQKQASSDAAKPLGGNLAHCA